MPPQDWSTLRPLPFARAVDDGMTLSAFVRSEVQAGRCTAAIQTAAGWTLKVDLAVLFSAASQPRRIVPRAIGCPSVEQYSAGLVSSMMRSGTPVASDLASFCSQSSWGISSSQPRKVTAKASLTASVTGYWVETGEFIRVFQYSPCR